MKRQNICKGCYIKLNIVRTNCSGKLTTLKVCTVYDETYLLILLLFITATDIIILVIAVIYDIITFKRKIGQRSLKENMQSLPPSF